MPVKWTPANTQILLWLAWGHCKYEVQNVLDAWPSIPGEEAPSKRAIQDRIQGMKKGIRDYGVASFFCNDMATLKKSRRVTEVSSKELEHFEQAKADDVDFKSPATAKSLQSTTNHHTSTVKAEVPDPTIKPENVLKPPTFKPENIDDTTNVYSSSKRKHYLATPPKTPGRTRPSTAKESHNRRKRRRSDTDTDTNTGPDSASPTTETSRFGLFGAEPDFYTEVRPDYWNGTNVRGSEGDTDDDAGGSSGGSDGPWVPGGGEGRGRRKRVRRDY